MNRTNKRILDFDTNLCIKVNNLTGNKSIDRTSYFISRLGDGSIYFVFLALFIFLFDKPVYSTARDYLSAAIINLLFYKLLKNKVKRIRPFNKLECINKIIPPPDEFSFPSGHSGAAAVFCCCTCYHMPFPVAVASIIWMLLVGFSRIYNGVHYPGDVLVGYLMGSATAKVVILTFNGPLG